MSTFVTRPPPAEGDVIRLNFDEPLARQTNPFCNAPALQNADHRTASVGILLLNQANQRLIEEAALRLGLTSIALDEITLNAAELAEFELVIADASIATVVQAMLADREELTAQINPALLVVRPNIPEPQAPIIEDFRQTFAGELTLPCEPAVLLAQLAMSLSAQRAFSRVHRSAIEELRLNRQIFRSVTSGISVTSTQIPDSPLVYVNPAFETLTGYSLAELLGKNCRILQGNESDQPGLTLIREALLEKREAITVLKNFRKDGTPFWNELSLSPIYSSEGVLTHFVGIQKDVTARVDLEAALRESEKLAAVGRLASSIAHEINNPLESVMNLIYLAQRSASLPDAHGFMAAADKELRRIAQLTTQSLRFYKQSSSPQAIRPSGLLDSVLDLYYSQIENASVSLERRDRTPESIVCMESEIRQVLNNLVRNAIDAMRGPGGQLYIRSRAATDWRTGRQGVSVTVADTGTGMSARTAAQIYTAFFTTKGIGGTGLGLWISSEIVGRHHGRLRVRSSQRPGSSGTVFSLFLPFQGVVA